MDGITLLVEAPVWSKRLPLPLAAHAPPQTGWVAKDILRFPDALAAVIAAKGAVVADVNRRGRRKRAKPYQKGAPEKSPEFVPHPDCAAAVVKRDAVWARWLDQES